MCVFSSDAGETLYKEAISNYYHMTRRFPNYCVTLRRYCVIIFVWRIASHYNYNHILFQIEFNPHGRHGKKIHLLYHFIIIVLILCFSSPENILTSPTNYYTMYIVYIYINILTLGVSSPIRHIIIVMPCLCCCCCCSSCCCCYCYIHYVRVYFLFKFRSGFYRQIKAKHMLFVSV